MCEETSFTKPGPSSHRRTDDHNSCGGEIADCLHKQQVLNYYKRPRGTVPMSAGKVPGPWGRDRSSQPLCTPTAAPQLGPVPSSSFSPFSLRRAHTNQSGSDAVTPGMQAADAKCGQTQRTGLLLWDTDWQTGTDRGMSFQGPDSLPFPWSAPCSASGLGARAP